MRTPNRVVSLVGLVATALAVVSGGSALAASQPHPLTMAAWQQAVAKQATPARGCYQASYPALQWHATRCAVAPKVALVPASGSPLAVGDGKDFSAKVTGTISSATGSFTNVSPGITESGGSSGASNTFSLQLNSQFFVSPECSGSSTKAKCRAWEQFVYDTDGNSVFIQYWLINYNSACPSGWMSALGTDCFTNSPSSTLPGGKLTASDLATVQLQATAKLGGNDQNAVSDGAGHATMVVNNDSKVTLAKKWNTTEWGVYGDGGGDQANFGANATIEAKTVLHATSTAAPTCLSKGFTGETNNLNLTATPAISPTGSPTMASRQTDGSTSTASCAAAA